STLRIRNHVHVHLGHIFAGPPASIHGCCRGQLDALRLRLLNGLGYDATNVVMVGSSPPGVTNGSLARGQFPSVSSPTRWLVCAISILLQRPASKTGDSEATGWQTSRECTRESARFRC